LHLKPLLRYFIPLFSLLHVIKIYDFFLVNFHRALNKYLFLSGKPGNGVMTRDRNAIFLMEIYSGREL